MDSVEIIGDKIWFKGYAVATLDEATPPSILDDFKSRIALEFEPDEFDYE